MNLFFFYFREEGLRVLSFLKKEFVLWDVIFEEQSLSEKERVLLIKSSVEKKEDELRVFVYYANKILERIYGSGYWDIYFFVLRDFEGKIDVKEFLQKFFYLVQKRIYNLEVFNFLSVKEVEEKFESYVRNKELIKQILIEKKEKGVKFFAQSIVNDVMNVVSYEILSRLEEEDFEGRLIMPAEFFYVLERERDLFFRFEELVFRKVVEEVERNLKVLIESSKERRVSVNFSIDFLERQFEMFKFYKEVLRDKIIIEVNEKDFSEKIALVEKTIKKLRDVGYYIVLDDFGEERNNFDRLVLFTYHGIKLGMFFSRLVKEILSDLGCDLKKKFLFDVVKTFIKQVKEYDEDFYICFEGIEDNSILNVVKAVTDKSKKYQGFLFGKPFLIEN